MNFLIQTVENEIVHDFSFHLIKAIEYNRWYYLGSCQQHDMIFRKCELDELNEPDNLINFETCIPIGSIEFVHDFLKEVHDIYINLPLNIPSELNTFEFLQREIKYGELINKNYHNLIEKDSFVKSNTKLKGFTDIIYIHNNKPVTLSDDIYLISELIEIESEWRGFVHLGNLIDIRNYSGNTLIFPNIDIIKKMIDTYRSAPISYTIDIAITDKNKTILIECHNFYSCGLYGFHDYRKLPIMFSQWWYEYLKRNNK